MSTEPTLEIEDKPKDWEEEFVLGHQKACIDETIISLALKQTVDNLEHYFEVHNIKCDVKSDLKTFIKIDKRKTIVIQRQKEDRIIFILEVDGYQEAKYIAIETKEHLFGILYVNFDKKETRRRFSLTADIIRELFNELIRLN